MRFFIISQPKAGTYLLSNILKNMGLGNSKLHFDPGLIRKFTTLKNFEEIEGTFEEGLEMIKNGCYAVGHMSYNKSRKESLKDFKKILITRNKKDIWESAERYAEEKNIGVYSIINDKNLKKISEWKKFKDVFHITFEDIVGKNTSKIDELQIFLFKKIKFNSLAIIEKSLNQDSLTKSSIR
jgi:hypothetical protein